MILSHSIITHTCFIVGPTLTFIIPPILSGNMDIGEMKKALLDGKHVKREGWYGNHHLEMVAVDLHWIRNNKGDSTQITNEPFVLIQTQKGKRGPWLCSPEDLLAEDWVIVSEDIEIREANIKTPNRPLRKGDIVEVEGKKHVVTTNPVKVEWNRPGRGFLEG